MKILTFMFELFALYLLYKLIFDLIIPLVKTTRQVKRQFGEMSARMQDHMNKPQQAPDFNTTAKGATSSVKNEDYIEFEEVKPPKH